MVIVGVIVEVGDIVSVMVGVTVMVVNSNVIRVGPPSGGQSGFNR